MYGRLFCAQIDEQGSSLVLYRFYRDALLRRALINTRSFLRLSALQRPTAAAAAAGNRPA